MATEKDQTPRVPAVAADPSAASIDRPARPAPVDRFAGALGGPAAASGGLLAAVWRGRWLVLACVILSLAAGFVCLEAVTPVYRSTSKLYLDYEGIRISPAYGSGNLPQTDKYLYTQAELLRSRPILTAAAETLREEGLRTFAGAQAPVAVLQGNLAVVVGKKDETVGVSFESPYPLEAAEIVNRIVDAYMASRSLHERQNSAQVLDVLQKEFGRANKELQEKRNTLADFQLHDMPLALGSDQNAGVSQRYLDVQTAYTQAQIATMEAESFRQGVQVLSKNPTSLQQYVQARNGSGTLVGTTIEGMPLESKLVELQLQKDKLLDRLTLDHPSVTVVAGEIEQIQQRIADLDREFVDAVVAAAEQRYVEARDYEERLARIYKDQSTQVIALNAEIAQYQRLRSEVDQWVRYAQTQEQEIREIRKVIGEDVGQFRMEVLEPALRAESPARPRKDKTMALALVFGLVIGGGLAVTRDWIDQTVRSADEIAATFGLPILGVVPAMPRRQSVRTRGRKVFLQPASREAEAFRIVRTALFFGTPKEGANTMLITSPASGDGKSTMVSNLGIAFARAGQKTLILDADFRKPIQHVIFGLDNRKRCLRGVLEGTLKLEEAIQPTQIEGLSLLTCGHSVSNPAEVLNDRPFAELLIRLLETYDRILVDAPPATAITDAQILSALCDFTVLVLRADSSTRRITQRAIDALQGVGGCVLGVVMNQVRRNGYRYGYYGGHGGSYRSGSYYGKHTRGQEIATGSNRHRLAAATGSKDHD